MIEEVWTQSFNHHDLLANQIIFGRIVGVAQGAEFFAFDTRKAQGTLAKVAHAVRIFVPINLFQHRIKALSLTRRRVPETSGSICTRQGTIVRRDLCLCQVMMGKQRRGRKDHKQTRRREPHHGRLLKSCRSATVDSSYFSQVHGNAVCMSVLQKLMELSILRKGRYGKTGLNGFSTSLCVSLAECVVVCESISGMQRSCVEISGLRAAILDVCEDIIGLL